MKPERSQHAHMQATVREAKQACLLASTRVATSACIGRVKHGRAPEAKYVGDEVRDAACLEWQTVGRGCMRTRKGKRESVWIGKGVRRSANRYAVKGRWRREKGCCRSKVGTSETGDVDV